MLENIDGHGGNCDETSGFQDKVGLIHKKIRFSYLYGNRKLQVKCTASLKIRKSSLLWGQGGGDGSVVPVTIHVFLCELG